MLSDDDLTPLSWDEYDHIALGEYHALRVAFFDLHSHLCRDKHPSAYMTVCIRAKGHPGAHITTSPTSTWMKWIKTL